MILLRQRCKKNTEIQIHNTQCTNKSTSIEMTFLKKKRLICFKMEATKRLHDLLCLWWLRKVVFYCSWITVLIRSSYSHHTLACCSHTNGPSQCLYPSVWWMKTVTTSRPLPIPHHRPSYSTPPTYISLALLLSPTLHMCLHIPRHPFLILCLEVVGTRLIFEQLEIKSTASKEGVQREW